MSRIKSVAVPILPNVSPFELGTVCEVFGIDRSEAGFPRYDFWLCGPSAGEPVPTKSGYDVVPPYDYGKLDDADLIAVPAAPLAEIYPEALLDGVRRAAARDAVIVSICSGAFVLGAAGLLEGRECTTHWMWAEQLQQRHPNAKVDPDVLYVESGNIWTSAGTAAGIDLCLHLIREFEGSEIARKLARRMVVPPQRSGGQKQYIETPLATQRGGTLESLLSWMAANLDEALTVPLLAERAHMAPRTFARRFRQETGLSPHEWLTEQRVLLARRLLESSDLTVDAVAARTGFGNAAVLRNHFGQRMGTTPQAYRATFRLTRRPA